ncbi:proline dehydrogenase 1, mitochondrial-like isoform X2 [Dreissena polymorpha]|uniref:proline dehydrogenase 1, mitochondrial-like isoform X2 n=1 Tax=Dreissena polymorpha TaxID=45954 RepID=UPI0022651F4F|nr:proline dehydrogenase 1, mitochondrial-like isoform X2 [Dreissena polymorpha]
MALRCLTGRLGHPGSLRYREGLFSSWNAVAFTSTTTAGNKIVHERETLVKEHPHIDLTFSNHKEAFRSKTTKELIRAYCVFQICSIPLIVNNNNKLMKLARAILGANLFRKLMKMTFYGHFVAGEDKVAIRPVVSRNRQFGVKSILDYSAEEDLSDEKVKKTDERAFKPEQMSEISKEPDHQRFQSQLEIRNRHKNVVSSRTYYYEGEEHCDRNMEIFLDAIDGVADATNKTGFCAIKLTALGRPELLIQMSDALVSTHEFFNNLISTEESEGEDRQEFRDDVTRGFNRKEFVLKLRELGVTVTDEDCERWFSMLDLGQDGHVDIFDWDNLLDVNMELSKLFAVPDPETGELKSLIKRMPLEAEMEMRNMLQRVDNIARYAMERDVRVMVDAEQSYFQPAINRLTMELMKKFNKDKAIIFNTYQAYLKAAYDSIKLDLDTAYRNNVYFGAKLVRGAYMEQERARAAAIGYEDPINPTFEATTAMYHKVLRKVMRTIQTREKGRVAVMVASHNEDTVKYTVELMKEYGVHPDDKVICFGQLLGMCDQVSFPLGQAGYSVYKYVPYGPVEEVLPYLSRRATENKGILAKVKKEKRLLRKEIWRRITRGQFLNPPPVRSVLCC